MSIHIQTHHNHHLHTIHHTAARCKHTHTLTYTAHKCTNEHTDVTSRHQSGDLQSHANKTCEGLGSVIHADHITSMTRSSPGQTCYCDKTSWSVLFRS